MLRHLTKWCLLKPSYAVFPLSRYFWITQVRGLLRGTAEEGGAVGLVLVTYWTSGISIASHQICEALTDFQVQWLIKWGKIYIKKLGHNIS